MPGVPKTVNASGHWVHAVRDFFFAPVHATRVAWSRSLRLVVTCLCGVGIYQASMIGLTHCQCFEQLDKVVHVLASFILTLLLRWSLDLKPVAVAAVAVCVGGLDEILQLFQPNRNADPLDFVANFLGALLAWLFLRFCLHNKTLVGENVPDNDFLV